MSDTPAIEPPRASALHVRELEAVAALDGRAPLVGTAFLAFLTALYFAHAGPAIWAGLWIAHFAVKLSSDRLRAAFLADAARESRAALWAARFTLVALGEGVSWGLVAAACFDASNPVAQVILALAILAVASGQTVLRAPYSPVAIASTAPPLVTVTLLLTLTDEREAQSAAVLIAFAAIASVLWTSIVHATSREAIRLRMANEGLIATLDGARKAAERERQDALAAREQLETGDRIKTEFLATVSHELRTPLHSIIGTAGLLSREAMPAAWRDGVSDIEQAAQGLAAVLNDILDLSKLDAGRLSLEAVPADPAEIAASVARMYQPRAWDAGLDLELSVAPDLPKRCLLDAGRFRQILVNLTGNAVKFTEKGGVSVMLTAETGPDGARTLCVRVKDSGIGIPADAASRLFRAFSQVDQRLDRQHGGVGLGLALAKRLTDLMGGTIGVESEPGRGSTFTVTLPLVEAGRTGIAAVLPSGRALPDRLSTAGLKVIAADDNPLNRATLSHILMEAGIEALILEDGLSALEAAGQDRFDAVIFDLQMPDLSGDDAARMLRAAPFRTGPRAILIASSQPEARVRGAGACDAADGFVPKPYAAHTLLPALMQALGESLPEAASLPAEAEELEALEQTLGRETLLDILKSFVALASEMTSAAMEAAEAGDGPAVERAARDLAGAASGLGFAALTKAARALSQAGRDGVARDELLAEAATIAQQSAGVRSAILRLYPDLAAA
jgi:signal transduction histidine kinase/CheY-like chemotaxis protein/HPt (histidine-containing phosphotransfer) domain-containing protein